VAAATAGSPELLLFEEIPVVISASRTEELVTQAPASVTVITREQILNSGAISIPDILRMAPGVDVQQNTGANWDVSIRGFDHVATNKVLVLIDGRTAYNDFYASSNWYELPVVLEDIERIEVIRGPLSSLWGANALLGVINIITREAADSQGTLATAQYGTRGAWRVNAIHGGQAPRSRVSYKLTAGHEEVGQWTPYSPAAQSPSVDHRKAGQATKATLTAQWVDRAGANWTVAAGQSDGYNLLLLDLTGDHKFWHEQQIYALADYRSDDLNVRAYWNGTRVRYDQPGFPATSQIDTDLYDIEALKSHHLSRHRILYGGSFRNKQLRPGGLELFSRQHQDLWAVYAEDNYRPSDKTRVVLSGRFDQHPLTGGRPSGRATVMYSLTPDQTLRLSAASAFRSPSFLESYLAVPFARLFGNTNLDNEGITSYDLEYRVRVAPKTSGGAVLYYNRLNSLIHVEQIVGPPPIQLFSNLGGARAMGVEFEVRHIVLPSLSAFANYTYQQLDCDPVIERDRPDIAFGSPRHKANVGLTLTDPERGLNGSLLLSYRDKTTAKGFSAGPYLMVNGYIGKRVGDGLEAGIAFFNLVDRHQEFLEGDQIGRRIMGSVRWAF
jgi:iron complex outermembrane receptor protein